MHVRQVVRVLKTPVTLIVLLAILGYGAVWGYRQVTRDEATTPTQTTCVTQDVGKELSPGWVTVRVFNGGETANLARLTAAYLRTYGFAAPYYNNTTRKVPTTVIVGHAADSPEVRLVQQFFTDAVAEGDGRSDHVVDVILGDKSERVKGPKTSVAVDGPVCLPPLSAPPTAGSPSPKATPSK